MRTTTRAALLAASASSALVLAGCAEGAPAPSGGGPVDLSDGLQIVTTTTQVHDFVANLAEGLEEAGATVEITPLLGPGESAHSFEPTAADLTAMAAADLVVESGMGLESWLDDAVASSGFAGTRVDASAGFDPESLHEGHDHGGDLATANPSAPESMAPIESQDAHDAESADEHAGHDHGDEAAAEDAHASEPADAHATESADEHAGHDHGDDGHDHGDGPNPHLWSAPAGAEVMVENIAAALEAADPAHADVVRDSADAYLGKLDALTEWITQNVDTVPEAERTVVTNHDALEYLNEQFHITQVGTIIPSWDDAAEPSAADIDELIANMKANGVTAIFTETQLSPATAETIAAQTGAKVYSGLDALYTDSLGAEGTPEATYIGAQIHNIELLMESWGHTASAAPAELTA